MSRSVHTTPIDLRAARRVRAPFAPRGAADSRRGDRLRRSLREAGLSPVVAGKRPRPEPAVRLPRIEVSRTAPGSFHPVTPSEIRRSLAFFGESAFYGVRSIQLLPSPDRQPAGLRLGRFIAPGTVRLFAVERSPWRLPGTLQPDCVERMRLYGALPEGDEPRGQMTIHWPGDSLRDFVLIDVLMHEIGHHRIQHHTGKRAVRVRRARDHEAFAEAFAERCRTRYVQERPLG